MVNRDEQTVVKATARIDWRKLAVPSLLIMVLPTVAAILLDLRLGTLPLLTIFAILICFPLATFLVIRISLQEMDRVIAEVAPPLEWQAEPQDDSLQEPAATSEPPEAKDGSAALP
jgi:hypothetical protein